MRFLIALRIALVGDLRSPFLSFVILIVEVDILSLLMGSLSISTHDPHLRTILGWCHPLSSSLPHAAPLTLCALILPLVLSIVDELHSEEPPFSLPSACPQNPLPPMSLGQRMVAKFFCLSQRPHHGWTTTNTALMFLASAHLFIGWVAALWAVGSLSCALAAPASRIADGATLFGASSWLIVLVATLCGDLLHVRRLPLVLADLWRGDSSAPSKWVLRMSSSEEEEEKTGKPAVSPPPRGWGPIELPGGLCAATAADSEVAADDSDSSLEALAPDESNEGRRAVPHRRQASLAPSHSIARPTASPSLFSELLEDFEMDACTSL